MLSAETGLGIDYTRDPFANYQAMVDQGRVPFPISAASRDNRLTPGTLIVGVENGSIQRVYPVVGPGVINDAIDALELVVFTWEGGGAAYSRSVGGETLTFQMVGDVVSDVETGSTWRGDGVAIGGPREGRRLDALPVRVTFWFAYVGAFPSAEIYQG